MFALIPKRKSTRRAAAWMSKEGLKRVPKKWYATLGAAAGVVVAVPVAIWAWVRR